MLLLGVSGVYHLLSPGTAARSTSVTSLQIEGDGTIRFVREELLQPGRMFDVHVAAQSEHDRVECCRAMDSVGPLLPSLSLAQRSKMPANPKWSVLLRAGLEVRKFLTTDREKR